MLYLLLRIRSFLNIDVCKLFYNAYILPYLDYCCTVWGNCSNDLLDDVYKFQKRAARIILDETIETSLEVLFKKLGWMKFKDRVEVKKATLMFKAISSSDVPIYLQTKFKKVSNNHNLRSVENTMLHVPRQKLEFFHKSLDYSGPEIWNEIPLNTRRS